MRAIFFGTPDIAVPALEALHSIATIVRVICQPDRPAGRGLAPKQPAVKMRARELGLDLEQPTKVRVPEFAESLRALDADVALVIAYGRILPLGVLSAPRRGCMNLHASILPKYRGAAPITWAVVDGERETGISLMQMDEGMDTGAVFAIERVPIGPDTTTGELSEQLGACAAQVVRTLLPRAVAGELEATSQDHAAATMARMLKKEDGRIDWTKPSQRVHDHCRGMTPWPGASATLIAGGQARTLKILRTKRCEAPANAPAGTIALAHRGRIEIACGEGRIELLAAQLEGRKALPAAELVGGRTLTEGMVLG